MSIFFSGCTDEALLMNLKKAMSPFLFLLDLAKTFSLPYSCSRRFPKQKKRASVHPKMIEMQFTTS